MMTDGGPVAEGGHKVSMTVYLTKTQLEKLKELRVRTKVPVAEYVREAIDLALKEHAAEIPDQVPVLHWPLFRRPSPAKASPPKPGSAVAVATV